MYRVDKRKIKKIMVPAICSIICIAIVCSILFVRTGLENDGLEPIYDNYVYVGKEIITRVYPVISLDETISRPYQDVSVTINRGFYDAMSTNQDQENAIIYFENTYMQNSGIDYSSDNPFDVVAILDGTVLNVSEDDLLGTIVEVRHGDNIIAFYQKLKDVVIKKGETLIKGQKIGISGQSTLDKDEKEHLHFELYINSRIVNPEEYYNKKIKDL